MVTPTRLIKVIVGAALLNGAVREKILEGLTKSMSRIMRPSTGSMIGTLMTDLFSTTKGGLEPGSIQALIKGLLAVVLFRSMKS